MPCQTTKRSFQPQWLYQVSTKKKKLNSVTPLPNVWSEGYCYYPRCLSCQSDTSVVRLFKSCTGHYSETTNDNCFIFSGLINLTWNLCTVILFWPSALKIWPSVWQFCLDHCSEAIDGNPEHCGAILTFRHLTLTSWPLPWKILHGLLLNSEMIHANSFIISGHTNLTCYLCIVGSFGFCGLWPLNYDFHYQNLVPYQLLGNHTYMATASYIFNDILKLLKVHTD